MLIERELLLLLLLLTHHPQSQSPCLMQCYILYGCSCLHPTSQHTDPPEEFHMKTITLGHLNWQVISEQLIRTVTPHRLLAFASAPAGPVSSSPTGIMTPAAHPYPVAQSHIVPPLELTVRSLSITRGFGSLFSGHLWLGRPFTLVYVDLPLRNYIILSYYHLHLTLGWRHADLH